jgi:multicomponent Na+:H+ antiporter subunit C
MNTTQWLGLCGAALVAIGLYGLIVQAHLLRRVLGFNMMGSGIFLLFGSLSARGDVLKVDPVPQAMIITGIVVSLAATALALALITRLNEHTAATGLPDEDPSERKDGGGVDR